MWKQELANGQAGETDKRKRRRQSNSYYCLVASTAEAIGTGLRISIAFLLHPGPFASLPYARTTQSLFLFCCSGFVRLLRFSSDCFQGHWFIENLETSRSAILWDKCLSRRAQYIARRFDVESGNKSYNTVSRVRNIVSK